MDTKARELKEDLISTEKLKGFMFLIQTALQLGVIIVGIPILGKVYFRWALDWGNPSTKPELGIAVFAAVWLVSRIANWSDWKKQ